MKKTREKAPSFLQICETFFGMIKLGMPSWIFCFIGVTMIGLGGYAFSLLTGMLLNISLNHFKLGSSAVASIGFLLFVLFAAAWIMALGYILNMASAMRIRSNIQKRLLAVWIRQTEAFASRRHSGESMTLVTSDMEIMENFYFQGLLNSLLVPLIQGIASVITVIGIDWRLAAAPVITGLFSLLFSIHYSGRIQEKNRSLRKETDGLTTSFTEMVSGNTTYRAMGITPEILSGYCKKSSLYADNSASVKNIEIHITFFAKLMNTLSLIFFFGTGIWLSCRGNLDFSLVLLAFPLQTLIGEMMNCFGNAWNFIVASAASGERIMEALKWPQEKENGLPENTAQKDKADLELKNIYFGYDASSSVLKDFSLTVESGKKVALVGSSGSGKSTVLQLLLRFYEQNSGMILLNGISSGQYSLDAWRSSFVLLQQNAPLLAKSIRENIAMGRYGDKYEASDKEIIAAAKAAGIHDFIDSLPDKYDTVVSEEGKNFSGGQKQRLAIARAFLSKAPIVLLDEPTAALDAESEKLVQQSLSSLMINRTVIMVAHRLETVRDFDEIAVLDRGTVAEKGTHGQLIAANGLYADLYRMQELA